MRKVAGCGRIKCCFLAHKVNQYGAIRSTRLFKISASMLNSAWHSRLSQIWALPAPFPSTFSLLYPPKPMPSPQRPPPPWNNGLPFLHESKPLAFKAHCKATSSPLEALEQARPLPSTTVEELCSSLPPADSTSNRGEKARLEVSYPQGPSKGSCARSLQFRPLSSHTVPCFGVNSQATLCPNL